jgi:stage II sporulation protein R
MKYKKTILSLSLLIISFTYIIHPFIMKRESHINGFKDQIIRFHIKANSDKEEDQALKLKVRDKILKDMGARFGESKSLEETRTIVENNIDNIKSITEEVIAEEGKDFSVEVSLGNKNFPTRKYGNITFPSGEYETLMVKIGEGKGKNWWCVMFPPLCFVDINHGNTSNKAEEDLREVLTEEEINLLLSNKEPPILLKSKIAEMVEKTKTHFAKSSAERTK